MTKKARLQTKPATPKPTISLSRPNILQRTCACGGVPGLTGECEACSRQRLSHSPEATNPSILGDRSANDHTTAQSQQLPLSGYSFGNLALAPKERLGIQTKLAIGQPGDRYEQEVDRVTDQVIQKMNAPDSEQSRQRRSLLNQDEKEEKLQNKQSLSTLQQSPLTPEDKEDEDKIQPKSILQSREAIAGREASADLESAIASARSGGQALDPGMQAQMGQAMGIDFSGVRVHTDDQSDQLNQLIQAKAFTTGQDVFFRQGAYNPGSRGGQELIAHELTHVVQQSTDPQLRFIQLSPLSDQLQQTWNTQGKGEFFQQLRNLTTQPDADVRTFVRNSLVGDDLWLAQNLLDYGREASWPIHLRVEREMKGWGDSGGKGTVFDILRTANGAEASNAPLTASINQIFRNSPDDLWLAQKLQEHGPEPRWPLADITERQRRAMANSWAPEPGNIRAVLGTGSHTVEAFYFRGTSDRRALIIGGVHGSEPGGVEVVNDLLTIMRSPNAPMPFFSVIIVPNLFSANVRARRRASGGTVGAIVSGRASTVSTPDPNRQFPAVGADPVSNAALGCVVDEQQRCIEPENLVLLDLVNRFQPERVASVHGHGNTSGNVAKLLKEGGPSITTDPRPGHEAEDDALALSMATEAKRLGVRIPGNFMGDPHQRTRYPTGTAPRMSTGVTFGQWGSHATPTRPSMNVILIETFGNTTSTSSSLNAAQQASRRTELMNLAQILRNFFLASP